MTAFTFRCYENINNATIFTIFMIKLTIASLEFDLDVYIYREYVSVKVENGNHTEPNNNMANFICLFT